LIKLYNGNGIGKICFKIVLDFNGIISTNLTNMLKVKYFFINVILMKSLLCSCDLYRIQFHGEKPLQDLYVDKIGTFEGKTTYADLIIYYMKWNEWYLITIIDRKSKSQMSFNQYRVWILPNKNRDSLHILRGFLEYLNKSI